MAYLDAIVWIVSIRPLISQSTSPCTNPLCDYQAHQLRPSIPSFIVFFSSSLAMSILLSLFLLSFCFTLRSVGTIESTIQQFLLLFFTVTTSGRLTKIRLSFCISKYQRRLYVSFSRTYLGFAYTIHLYGQI